MVPQEDQGAISSCGEASLKRRKSSTLTREADPPPPLPTVAAASKPQVPAKPAHIRPGLKPVKIPTVDDKVWVNTKLANDDLPWEFLPLTCVMCVLGTFDTCSILTYQFS